MRIVFDTNVLVRAHPAGTGSAHRAVWHTIHGGHILITSHYILTELERVLSYPRIQKSFHISAPVAGEYLSLLLRLSEIFTPTAIPDGLLRDQKDAPIIGTALSGNAKILCTGDADLFDTRIASFCAENGLQILTDAQLLRLPEFGI